MSAASCCRCRTRSQRRHAGTPRTSTSAREWTGIPHGSWLELKIRRRARGGDRALHRCGRRQDVVSRRGGPGQATEAARVEIYDLRIEVAFELASSAEVACRIVKPDGTTYGKPYRLELSGDAGDVAHAEIRALTAKA